MLGIIFREQQNSPILNLRLCTFICSGGQVLLMPESPVHFPIIFLDQNLVRINTRIKLAHRASPFPSCGFSHVEYTEAALYALPPTACIWRHRDFAVDTVRVVHELCLQCTPQYILLRWSVYSLRGSSLSHKWSTTFKWKGSLFNCFWRRSQQR